MEIISKKTRRLFEDHFVIWGTLRTIETYFLDNDLNRMPLTESEAMLAGGQRRTLVHEHYKAVNWKSHEHVAKIIKVFESVLNDIEDYEGPQKQHKEKLLGSLQADGFTFKDNRLLYSTNLPTPTLSVLQQTKIINTSQLKLHMDRIEKAIDTDPDLAIGNAKELLETICKNLLDKKNIPYSNKNDLPDLMKLVCKELKLTPDDIHENKKGVETIKRVLGNLTIITTGVAELRNLYGTGHGKGKSYKGLSGRHARLAVGASYVLATFLIETLEEKL